MLRIFRYLKSLFVKKQANVKVVSPKEHEQKPPKYVARVVPNETQDIVVLHRSRTIPFVRQQTKTDDYYNHSVSSIISQPDSDLLNPVNPLSPLNNYWLDDDNKPKHNHSDDYSRTTNHDVDYSRHNNHDYSPSHSDSSYSHHDYTPSYDSGTSYDSGSSDW